MLSQVTPKAPELMDLEPVAEIGGRSWQYFLRGQYHETRDAPPLSPADAYLAQVQAAAAARRQIGLSRREAQHQAVLAILKPHWQSFKAIHEQLGWTYDKTRRVVQRLVTAGRLEKHGTNSRWHPPVYRKANGV